jgi:HEAT repeat protein
LFCAVLASALTAVAAPKTEDELIAALASPKEKDVTSALLQLEKQYPTSTKAFPEMKKLLTDDRLAVKRKAARVLGSLHAEVSQQDLDAICTLLKESNRDAVIDGLKALRGLKAQSTIPKITPLLKDSSLHPNVIRDACRTLAVLGNKDVIPEIEPLLKNSNPAIQKDAQDAIYKLQGKS